VSTNRPCENIRHLIIAVPVPAAAWYTGFVSNSSLGKFQSRSVLYYFVPGTHRVRVMNSYSRCCYKLSGGEL